MTDRQPGGQQNGGGAGANQKKGQGAGQASQAQRQSQNRSMQQMQDPSQAAARREKQADKGMVPHPAHAMHGGQPNPQAMNMRTQNHPAFGQTQQQHMQQQLQGVAPDGVMNPAQVVYGAHGQAGRVGAGQMQHLQGVMPGGRGNGQGAMMDPQQMVQAHGANQVGAGHYPGMVGGAPVSAQAAGGHHPAHVQQLQASQQAKTRKQNHEQDHVTCIRIQEELSSLCHMDNLVGSHSNLLSLYKKLQRAQGRGKDVMKSMPGNREIRKEEPPAEMAHQDFLIKEMQDMAQDFREETYTKRYVLARLAYEAQAKALARMKAKAMEDKGSAVQIISGPGDAAQNLKTQTPFDRPTDQDDLLAGPGARPQAQLGAFPDRALARQTTDPLGDDPLAMPQPQPLQSPGGSLGSLLGSPGAPQEAMDLDDLFNQDDGDGANDASRSRDSGRRSGPLDVRGDRPAQAQGSLGAKPPKEQPKDPSAMVNDFFADQPKEIVNKDGDADMKDLFNPKAVENMQMEKDASKAAPPQESALADEREFGQKPFINKEDVLMTTAEMLQDMGDVEKRNQEFADLMDQAAVDSKYLFYKDNTDKQHEDDQQYVIQPDPDLVKLNKEMRKKERHAAQQSRLFSNKVVSLVHQYYEEKYVDLESRKTLAEIEYEKAQTQKYQSIEYRNQLEIEERQDKADEKQLEERKRKVDDEARNNEGAEQRRQHINIDSLLNDGANARVNNGADQLRNANEQKQGVIGYQDVNRGIISSSGPGLGAAGYNGYRGGESRDNVLGSFGGGLNDVGGTGPGVYQNNVVDMPSSLLAAPPTEQTRGGQAIAAPQQPQNRDSQGYQTEEVQVEVLFQPDIFQIWEDRQEEMATRSNTHMQSHDGESLAADGQGLDLQGQQSSAIDRHNDTNMEDSDGSVDIEDAFKNELKPENANAKILPAVYRFGQDFLQDVCNQTDRELIRCFPNLTDPEHTMLLLDIFTRRKHLDCQAKLVDKIAQKNRELIRHERLEDQRPDNHLKELKDEIRKDEQKLWTTHQEFFQQRVQQAKEFSLKFKNVYHNSSQTIRDLKKSIHSANQRNSSNKQLQLFNDSEVAFMRWYVSIFGDNWRLIVNVLNYHPFTRGYLRTKESLQEQFIHYMNAATHSTLLNDHIQLKPWRTTGQPLLITERPPSLYCSIKQVNQMHHTKIKSLDHQRENPKRQRVVRIVSEHENPRVEFVRWQTAQTREKDQSERRQEKKRPGGDDGGEGRAGDPNDGPESSALQVEDDEVVQDVSRLMSANDYDGESYIHKFYLGQKIDEVLRGDLKRPPPNFGFQSCHNRRKSCSRLQPLSTCQKRQRTSQFEEQKQQAYPSFGSGKLGGGKSSSLMQSQSMMNSGRLQQQQNDKSQQGLEITPEEMNTPMFCALHENKSNTGSKSVYVKSVSHQAGIMFWLGYLYKKIAQSRMEQKVRIINESGTDDLRKFERTLAQQIASQHTREARRIRIRSELPLRKLRPQEDRWQLTPQERQEIRSRETLQNELLNYKVETSVGLMPGQGPTYAQDPHTTSPTPQKEFVNHLWDDMQSIFHFDPAKLSQYLDTDRANMRGERKLDSIIDTMETKWDRMDRYWFQKNRHLDQKMRKKKDYPPYYQQKQQQWTPGGDNQVGATAGGPGGGNPNMGPVNGQMGMQQAMDGLPPRHEQDKNQAQNMDSMQAIGQEGGGMAQSGHFMQSNYMPRDQQNAGVMQPQQTVPNHVNQGQPPFAGVGPAGANLLQPQDDSAAAQSAPMQPSRDPRAPGNMPGMQGL